MSDFKEIEILLVEDNPDDARLTMRALKKHNLANNLVQATDGAKALDIIFGDGENGDEERQLNNIPKLILLDLRLPKVDGLEVLRRLKTDDRSKNIPVVVLTSSNEERDVVESYKLGVNSYIVKPVDFEKFMRAVSEVGVYWLIMNRQFS